MFVYRYDYQKSELFLCILYQYDALGGDKLSGITGIFQRFITGGIGSKVKPKGGFVFGIRFDVGDRKVFKPVSSRT